MGMTTTTQRAVVTATVPTILALAVTAFAVLEHASVDPTVSAGRLGSSSIPVWYVPLAVFAMTHTLGLLTMMRGRTAGSLIAGLGIAALAIAFHISGAAFTIGELIYGLFVIIALFLPPLFILLPIGVALAIGVPGAIFGASIYAPIAVARRFASRDDLEKMPTPTRDGLILAGVVVAAVCVLAFGVPSDAARGARGDYTFAQTSIESAWLATSAVIALCCVVIVVAGVWPPPLIGDAGFAPWIKAFIPPVAVLVAAGGPAVRAIEASEALRALRSAPGISEVSRYFRDGRSLSGDPIRFANGELRVDRSLVRYQLADNAQRRITTVALYPPPELKAIGVIDRVILNGWHAEPHGKEAEYRRAVCADSATRPIVECRLANGAVVIQIDKQHPERGLVRGTTLTSQTGCLIIITAVPGRAFGIRADFDCDKADDWPLRAVEIERYVTALHVVR